MPAPTVFVKTLRRKVEERIQFGTEEKLKAALAASRVSRKKTQRF